MKFGPDTRRALKTLAYVIAAVLVLSLPQNRGDMRYEE